MEQRIMTSTQSTQMKQKQDTFRGFPRDFIWGAASASYQTEGGAFEDGKGPSIWDVFSHEPGRIADGHTGDTACDGYHRFEEDLDLLQRLAIPNYRFSVSWPRVIPEGTGRVNEAGLAYYERLIDGCLARGITPWLTLYHWDLPQALQEKGGWLNRETASAFRAYTEVIVRRFQGKVRHFITINEPQIIVGLGHAAGLHAPGLCLTARETFTCWHHLLLAHGLAAETIRSICPEAQIGISSTGSVGYLQDHPEITPQALADFTFHTPMTESMDGSSAGPADNFWFNHQWFLDPVCRGAYPDDPVSPWSEPAKKISPADLAVICQPLDFIGLNVYNGTELDPGQDFRPAKRYPGYPRTSLKWPVTPPVIYWACRLVHERYGLPVIVTENGQGCHDRIFRDGLVHDPDRIDFLTSYLEELALACRDGIPVKGYFHWSLTDNLEWHSGYDDRFGLIYIDYRNQQRIPKDSACWYGDLIRRLTDSCTSR